MKSHLVLFFLILCLFLSGCASYTVPGKKADLSELAPVNMQSGFDSQPSNPFPANITAVRIQEKAYTNFYLNRSGGAYGEGKYSVVLVREVETEDDYKRIVALPGIEQIVSLNRMLIPSSIFSLEDLRMSASRIKADLLFVYTFDTSFFDEDKAKPLTVISLGLSPNRRITATTTVSALLIDTRTAHIYGVYESTASESKISTSWGSEESADQARRETERRAFEMLIEEFENSWSSIYPPVVADN